MLEGLARAHPIVIAIDETRRIAWMSDELGVIYPGAARCIGQPIDSLLDAVEVTDPAIFMDRVRAFVDELHETGRVSSARFEFGPHPTVISVEVSAFRVQSDDGRVLAVCMTRRIAPNAPIAAETARIDPESRLAFILDATPDGVLTVDRLGFVTTANAAAGRLLGYSADQLIDKPLSQFVTKSVRAQRIAEAIAKDGAIESEEVEIARADGARAWLSISARSHVFTRTDATQSWETIVFIRDVTERQLSRMALERKNEELENCVRSVAHDLRSPLTSLLGFTNLLRTETKDELSTSGQQFLNRIEEAGRNMARLLKGMLELSRVGSSPVLLRPVDLRPVLEQLRSELKLRLERKNIELSIPESPPTLIGDPTRLYQLLSNLVGNAVSHMPATDGDDARGHIEVEIVEIETGWRICVADDGPGIALEDQDRIFEMFQTAGNTSGHTSGHTSEHTSGSTAGTVAGEGKSSGLGLAIVKKIVESHHGKVWVESDGGLGARFVVHLPRASSDAPS